MLLNETISVIVPVYNVAPYLKQCLDSIMQQTYSNLEIILIDDGSTDQSGTICDEYALTDSRIIVLHQQNQGLSAARNKRLDICTGAYIFFVDSDDYIDYGLLETLYKSLIEKHVDMVGCYAENIVLMEGYKPWFYPYHSQVFYENSIELLRDIYTGKLPIEVWGKLYTRSVFLKCRFDVSVKRSEDAIMWLDLRPYIHTCIYLHCRTYYVQCRANSLQSLNKFDENFKDDIYTNSKLWSELSKLNNELGMIGKMRYFDNIIHFMEDRYRYGFTREYIEQEKNFQKEIGDNIFSLIMNPFLNYKKKISLLLLLANVPLYYWGYKWYHKLRKR